MTARLPMMNMPSVQKSILPLEVVILIEGRSRELRCVSGYWEIRVAYCL